MSSAIVSHTGGFVTPDSGTWQFEGEIITQGWSEQEVLLYIDYPVSSIGMGGGTTISYECAGTSHTYTVPAPYYTACFPSGSDERVEAGDPFGNRIRYVIHGGSTASGLLSMHASSHDVFDRQPDGHSVGAIGGVLVGCAPATGVAVGDILLFTIAGLGGTSPITGPPGYSLWAEDWAASGDSNVTISLHLYYKVAATADLTVGPIVTPGSDYTSIFPDLGTWTNTTTPEDSLISHIDATGGDVTLNGHDITTVDALAIGIAVSSYVLNPPVVVPISSDWSGKTQQIYNQNVNIAFAGAPCSMEGSYLSRYRPPTAASEPHWFTTRSGIVGMDFVLPTTETNIEVTDTIIGVTPPGRGNIGIVAAGNAP